jgi:hypothetical protein
MSGSSESESLEAFELYYLERLLCPSLGSSPPLEQALLLLEAHLHLLCSLLNDAKLFSASRC